MWLLLLLCLMSCRIDTIPEVEPIPEVVEENTLQGIILEYTLQGIYKRSIGSQYEIYDIGDKLRVYIDDKKIYEADYTYTDTDIIINGNKFDYVLSAECIIICGYTYYRYEE